MSASGDGARSYGGGINGDKSEEVGRAHRNTVGDAAGASTLGACTSADGVDAKSNERIALSSLPQCSYLQHTKCTNQSDMSYNRRLRISVQLLLPIVRFFPHERSQTLKVEQSKLITCT